MSVSLKDRLIAAAREDEDTTVIDGSKYTVVISRSLGVIFRVRKPRVGLCRFSR